MNALAQVAGYFASPYLWQGALLAVKITVIAMAVGLVLGLGLALARLSHSRVLSMTAWVYIWVVRGTPQLLQLVFIFDALPAIGLKFDSFLTAVIGFSLNQAAFSAEVLRGGILSVNPQQSVAATSLGMGRLLTLRRIILPQAMRAILPAITNDTIGMLKLTSIASIIFVNELTFRAQGIVGQNFQFFTVFAGVGLIYLAMTSVISGAQQGLDHYYNPDRARKTAPAVVVAPEDSLEAIPAKSRPAIAPDQADFVKCYNVQKAYGSHDATSSPRSAALRRGCKTASPVSRTIPSWARCGAWGCSGASRSCGTRQRRRISQQNSAPRRWSRRCASRKGWWCVLSATPSPFRRRSSSRPRRSMIFSRA
jgi:polar amino acid transport system permease protein